MARINFRRYRLEARTRGSHPRNRGSIPRSATVRIFSVCLIAILFVYLSLSNIVLARTDYHFGQVTQGQIDESLGKVVPVRFLPSHPLYFLISIKENVARFFKPSSRDRAEFDFVLTGKRLKETYLLLSQNDFKNASRSLSRYSQVVDRMIKQLAKAKSQNQDVVAFADRISDDLSYQDKLLIAIWQKWQNEADIYSFDQNLERSILSFKNQVSVIDSIKPGIKNRYIITKNIEDSGGKTQPNPSQTPSFVPIFESSGSGAPRRIIY